ncbi:MAG TPA: response regulator [Ktedonobacterales bacterium]
MAQVLIVDDDQPTREVLRLILEDAGHEVVETSGGSSALELLRASERRVLVLLDQLMPGLDGTGVLAMVASDLDLATRHAYILLSADVRPLGPMALTLLTTLGVPLIRKPFDIDDLLETVARSSGRLAG